MEENKNVLTENNTGNNNPQLVPSKSNKGLITLLVFIILLLAAALVYILFFNKDKEKVIIDDNKTEEKQEGQEPTGDYELTVYKFIDDGRLCSFNKPQDDITEAFKIKVKNSDAEVLEVFEDSSYVLYSDGTINIYDVKNNTIKETKLSNAYSSYDFYKNEKGNKVIGISFKDDEDIIGYYNVSLEKVLYYDKGYKNTSYPFLYQLDDQYITVATNKKTMLLSSTEEKTVLSYVYGKNEGDWLNYWKEKVNNSDLYVFGACPDVCMIRKIYNSDFKEIFSGNDIETYTISKNNLYILDNGVIKQYNDKGQLVKEFKDYKNIKDLASNYVVYTKNNSLYADNLENEGETVEICSWNESWSFDFAGYYTRERLDEIGEKDKKEGLYVVFYYGYDKSSNPILDGKGNYGMEYCYSTDKQIVDYPIKEEMGGRAKPVLYLYPEKEMDVTIKFSKPNLLTTTYPKYINSWNVRVKPNGDMYDANGKYYYALYWDETRYNEVDFKEGFYVEGKDAINFLEEKLTIIGLNDKERNEFIMYWLPIMERNGKNLVYFELTNERESGNKLIIEPKPDSLLRVSIHIKKVNEKINIKEEKLQTFNRTGFTAVEWGGMTY
jgi:hypothetical protein